MKKLSTYINESLGFTMINESFKSNLLRDLRKKTSNELWNQIFTAPAQHNWIRLKWDLIEDEHIKILTPKEANRYKNHPNPVIWIGPDGSPLGLSRYDDIYSNYPRPSDKKFKKAFKTFASIQKAAVSAYIITDDEKYEARDLRYGRWRSKLDAAAYDKNEKVLKNNKKRYENILKLKKDKSVLKQDTHLIDEIENELGLLMKRTETYYLRLERWGNWDLIDALNNRVEKIMISYGDMISNFLTGEDNKNNLYEKTYNEVKTSLSDANELMNELEFIEKL